MRETTASLPQEEIRQRAAVLALQLLELGKLHNRRSDKLYSDEWKPILEELGKIEDQIKEQAKGRDFHKEKWLHESEYWMDSI